MLELFLVGSFLEQSATVMAKIFMCAPETLMGCCDNLEERGLPSLELKVPLALSLSFCCYCHHVRIYSHGQRLIRACEILPI